MAALPVATDEVKKVIAELIKAVGLETVTSSRIRNHLKEKFDTDFTEYKKAVDEITKEVIDEQQKNDVTDSDDSDVEPPPKAKENSPEPGNSADSSSSDDGVLSTDRARPRKGALKRKAKDSDDDEPTDLISGIKFGRRTAARQAAKKISNAAGWMANKPKREKTDLEKSKITKGTKLVYVSDELQEITGQKFMRRCDVVKECWRYVKEHDRMDPKDKRYALIEGDPALEKIFKGKRRIQMFGVMGLLHRHLLKPDDVGPELSEECEEYRGKLIAEWNAKRAAEREGESVENSDNENSKDVPETSEKNGAAAAGGADADSDSD